MPLINDSFMISNPTGKKLYLEIAREQPIIDYHCHLEAKAIWEGANKRGNSSRLTQSFHFFMFEPIFSPVNALNQPI